MQNFNIYMCGVGGQGIGLLNEILIRASRDAGYNLKGVDTHGLAQRGGIVQSHLKLGDVIYSPMIPKGEADIVIALEIHEALRALYTYLKKNGTLVYYNTQWQPSELRLNKKGLVLPDMIEKECLKRDIQLYQVFSAELPDARMQNIAVIARICKDKLIPDLKKENFINSMKEIMNPEFFKKNIDLFNNLT